MANKETQPEEVGVSDINNPPKVPYTYQPFPKTVYRLKEKPKGGEKAPKEWENKIVNNEQELKEAEGKGWKKEAPPPDDAEAETAGEHEKGPAPAKK